MIRAVSGGSWRPARAQRYPFCLWERRGERPDGRDRPRMGVPSTGPLSRLCSSGHNPGSMITLLLHLLRLLPFLCGGHRRLPLENLALRQQLAVYKPLTRSRQESGVREICMRRSNGRGLETGALCTAPALDPTLWRLATSAGLGYRLAQYTPPPCRTATSGGRRSGRTPSALEPRFAGPRQCRRCGRAACSDTSRDARCRVCWPSGS